MKLYIESKDQELDEQAFVQIVIRFRPKRLLAITLVLLLHSALLFLLMRAEEDLKQGKPVGGPMVFVLEKLKQVKKGEPLPQKAPPKTAKARQEKVITPPPLVEATTDLPPIEPKEAIPDMAAMIQAARDRRQQTEAAASAENHAALQGNRGQSPQEIAETNVRHSMQRASAEHGTNGVFQIISKSVRMGTFTFRGWKVNSNNWKQTIEVDAGLGGNIDLAMVRKMIEIIRTHYKGDFNWESQRLGRVINLSARLEDSAELEAFMLEEFPQFAKPKR